MIAIEAGVLVLLEILLLRYLISRFSARFSDIPNERSSHTAPVPRVGGLGLFLVFIPVLFATLWMHDLHFSIWYWLGLILIFTLGFLDDLYSLNALIKLAVQTAVALLYVLGTNKGLHNLYGLFGINELPYWLGTTLSIVFLVYIINALNLIDGVDGLAGGTTLISLFFMWWVLKDPIHQLTYSLLIIGIIVFLGFNFNKRRKTFLGDSGSLTFGYILGIGILDLLSGEHFDKDLVALGINPILMSALILGYPLLDTTRVFLVRIFKGLSPFHADRRHIHHGFLNKGFSHAGTSTFIMSVMFILGLLNYGLTAGRVNDHMILVINIGFLLGMRFLVKFQTERVLIVWKFLHFTLFRPLKLAWLKWVDSSRIALRFRSKKATHPRKKEASDATEPFYEAPSALK